MRREEQESHDDSTLSNSKEVRLQASVTLSSVSCVERSVLRGGDWTYEGIDDEVRECTETTGG